MATSSQRASARGKKPEKIEITEEDKNPGVVYVGHIPHGFYEDEMKGYFSQFGDVLAVKLSRSKKTGRSKGYAFIKFRYAAVAKTVAETCNNYLFFNRLLKCSYRPMSEVRKGTFKFHSSKPVHKEKAVHNADKSEENLKVSNKKARRKLRKKMKDLADSGIEIDLNEVLELPQYVKETKIFGDKGATPSKAKDEKGKNRQITLSGDKRTTLPKVKNEKGKKRQITELESERNDINVNEENLTSPAPKRRKKISNFTEKNESKEKLQVGQSTGKPSTMTVSKEKAMKVSPSGKKASPKSMKKGKRKDVVTLGIRKPGSRKRKMI